ncbi:hypothetical protein BC938DRAFT_470731, partial [Jimgerdemannia flammicorona]
MSLYIYPIYKTLQLLSSMTEEDQGSPTNKSETGEGGLPTLLLPSCTALLDDLKAQKSNPSTATADLQSKLAAYSLKEKEWERTRQSFESRQQILADQSAVARRALDLEKKLGQAGSHLKTLAQENSVITQRLEKYAKLEVGWEDKFRKAEEGAAERERELRGRIEGLEKRLEEERGEIEAEKKKVQVAEEEATSKVREMEETVAKTNKDLAMSRSVTADLESRLAERDSAITTSPDTTDQTLPLLVRIKELESRIRDLEKDVEDEGVVEDSIVDRDTPARVRELENRCAALEADKGKAEEVARKLETAREVLVRELEAFRNGTDAPTVAHTDKEKKDGGAKDLSAPVVQALDALLEDAEHTGADPEKVPLEVLGALERVRAELERRQKKEREAEAKAAGVLEKAKAEHAKAFVEIQSSHNKLAEEKAQLESDYETLTDRLETLTSTHHQTLSDIRTQHDATLAERDRLLADHRAATDKIAALESDHMRAVSDLRRQLERVTEEKAQLSKDYNAILERLMDMKNALAPKLQADLEESRQLRQRLASLTSDHADLQQTATQLRVELGAAHDRLEQTTLELAQLRTHLLESSQEAAREVGEREDELRAAQVRLDRVQREKEEWELLAMEERGTKEQVLRRCRQLEKEAETHRVEVELVVKEREREAESLTNLQAVLEEFQAAKESEIRFAVEGLQRQLNTANTSLQEFQRRALSAEEQLEQLQRDIARARQLEKEVKEKNLLIGKLRHEAVILNEHLVEAMRRLKQESSENNVDRRLMTNLLITFLNAPRGDRKRYDTLTVMASVLQLTDEQKEQVGLIRRAGAGMMPGTPGAMPSTPGWVTPAPRKSGELEYPAEVRAFHDFPVSM